MNFKIMSRKDAIRCYFDEPHIIISISDPELEFVSFIPNEKTIDTLKIKFDDITRPISGYSEFTYDQAKCIVDFVLKNKDKISLIAVNCEMGISRSAAVVWALLEILEGTDGGIPHSARYCPNSLVRNKIKEHWTKINNEK